jgi:translation initiation factor 1
MNSLPHLDPYLEGKDQSKVHIRVQQRNGRKCVTTIQGLASDLDVEKIARALKKTFKCNGSIQADEEVGEVRAVECIQFFKNIIIGFRDV